MKQGFIYVFFAVLAVLAGWFWQTKTVPNTANPAVAALVAGPWKDANGDVVTLVNDHKTVLVVNFWATWCPPCIKEMPELSALATEFQNKKVRFVGIGIDSAAKIREFSAKTPISYSLVASGFDGAEVAKNLGNIKGGLPFTVVIDANGNVVETVEGIVDIAALRSKLALISANK